MFFPLHDGVPIHRLRAPFGTWAAIGICAVVWMVFAGGLPGWDNMLAAVGLGVIPAVLFGPASLPDGLPFVPVWMTPASSILVHAGAMHLAGNMLFLWVFGDNVEDAFGHFRFALFFLLCGVAGALAHCFANPASEFPLVGASGAISGVIAAYLILHPHARVFGLALKFIPLRIPAYIMLGAWILMQVAQALIGPDGNVGWWAHIGGLVAGAALTPLFVQPGVKLFSRPAPPVT